MKIRHAWMLSVCDNPKHDDYPKFGGAGVTVSDHWRNFGNFRDDMLPTLSGSNSEKRLALKPRRKRFDAESTEWIYASKRLRS